MAQKSAFGVHNIAFREIFDFEKFSCAYSVIHLCLKPSIHFPFIFRIANYLQYFYRHPSLYQSFQFENLSARRCATRQNASKDRVAVFVELS